MKNMKNAAIIALRSIITFLFFLPRLIIEFNYSGSVFLICFPHFLANWLCIPIFSCLLFACPYLLASYTHSDEYNYKYIYADKCTVNVPCAVPNTYCVYRWQENIQETFRVNCNFLLLRITLVTEVKMRFLLMAHTSKSHQLFSFCLPCMCKRSTSI